MAHFWKIEFDSIILPRNFLQVEPCMRSCLKPASVEELVGQARKKMSFKVSANLKIL
jgi:hypothetical protein